MNGANGHAPEPLISGLAHVNLTIPRGTLDQAFDFYGDTLGLTSGELEAMRIDDGQMMLTMRSPGTSTSERDTRLVSYSANTVFYHTLTASRFNIADSGQMIHVAFNDIPNAAKSTVGISITHPLGFADP